MAAHQAPPSLGFSRQERWSGLPFPSSMHESEKWKGSRSVVSDPQWPHGLQPSRLLCPWDFLGRSTGVGCHCLLRCCYFSFHGFILLCKASMFLWIETWIWSLKNWVKVLALSYFSYMIWGKWVLSLCFLIGKTGLVVDVKHGGQCLKKHFVKQKWLCKRQRLLLQFFLQLNHTFLAGLHHITFLFLECSIGTAT